MTSKSLAAELFLSYEEYRLDHLRPSNCRHPEIVGELGTLVRGSAGMLTMRELGRSVEGRSINMVSCGHGPINILLWSQMHGDESTATLALMDGFQFLVREHKRKTWVDGMLAGIAIHAIVMLNPDGADRVQRHTAVGIDMNRDARVLATPEARVLREAQQRLQPTFGFNLHDQTLSSVGSTPKVAVLALLAPALDGNKSLAAGRVRAMRIGACIVRSLGQFVDGHISTYDDSFEPRAFGDSMQMWGTSTLLIESGHWPGDPEKLFVRKLNYVAILTSLGAIANGSYQDVELDHYTGLVANGKNMFDYIIRGVLLAHVTGWTHQVDVGLSVDPAINRGLTTRGNSTLVTVKEVGDLSAHGALATLDANGRTLSSNALAIDKVLSLVELLDQLQLPAPA